MKHKVKMLKTTLGVDDGQVIAITYWEGKEYLIGSDLLSAFTDMAVIELADNEQISLGGDVETKVEAPAETKPARGRAKK